MVVSADQFQVSGVVATAYAYRNFVMDFEILTAAESAFAAVFVSPAYILTYDFHAPIVIVSNACFESEGQ